MSDSITVTVEFLYVDLVHILVDVALLIHSSGGLDALFSNQRKINLFLPARNEMGQPADMNFLIGHLCEHHLTDHRKDFFVLDNTM